MIPFVTSRFLTRTSTSFCFFIITIGFMANSCSYPPSHSASDMWQGQRVIQGASSLTKKGQPVRQVYLDFFQKVYATMEQNYYQAVSPQAYQEFLDDFDAKIYKQLKEAGKSNDFVRWRSEAFL